MFFFAVTRVSESLVWFKTVLLCLEGLTLWLLARLLVSFNLPRERVLIYAWNPLVIWEFFRPYRLSHDRPSPAGLARAARPARYADGNFSRFAVLVKFFPLVLFPALYRRWDWKMPLAATATICLGYLPYLGAGAGVFGFLSGYANEEGMGRGRFFLLLLARYVTGGAEFRRCLPRLLFRGAARLGLVRSSALEQFGKRLHHQRRLSQRDVSPFPLPAISLVLDLADAASGFFAHASAVAVLLYELRRAASVRQVVRRLALVRNWHQPVSGARCLAIRPGGFDGSGALFSLSTKSGDPVVAERVPLRS